MKISQICHQREHAMVVVFKRQLTRIIMMCAMQQAKGKVKVQWWDRPLAKLKDH